MIRRGPATAADQPCPGVDAGDDPLGERPRLKIEDRPAVDERGTPRVRLSQNGAVGVGPECRDNRRHLRRAEIPAVGPHDVGAGLGKLPGALFGRVAHHGPASVLLRLERDRDEHGQLGALFTRGQRTKRLAQVEHRLDQKRVDAGLRQDARLLDKRLVKLRLREGTVGLEQLAGRTEVSQDASWLC